MPRKKKGDVAGKLLALDEHLKAVVKKHKEVLRDSSSVDKKYWRLVLEGQKGKIARSEGVVKAAKTQKSMAAFAKKKAAAKRRKKKAKK